jgi:hypothetical protein
MPALVFLDRPDPDKPGALASVRLGPFAEVSVVSVNAAHGVLFGRIADRRVMLAVQVAPGEWRRTVGTDPEGTFTGFRIEVSNDPASEADLDRLHGGNLEWEEQLVSTGTR